MDGALSRLEAGVPGSGTLSSAEFDFFVAMAREHAGIALGPSKRTMVAGRIAKVMRRHQVPSVAAYVARLQAGTAADVAEFVDAITTNLTAFFREPHHFEYLRDHALPELMAARQASQRLRIWSAGCSTGEEPYSLALVLDAALGGERWDARILATDIDATVLQKAAAGVYPVQRLTDVPEVYQRTGFQRGTGARADSVRVRPAIAERVSVRRLNLMEAWPMQCAYDVIFCRNVAIYFDKPTQRTLVERFAERLQPNGFLFIGHSESLFQVSDRFAPLGRTIYRKVA